MSKINIASKTDFLIAIIVFGVIAGLMKFCMWFVFETSVGFWKMFVLAVTLKTVVYFLVGDDE
ncbi:hypothetical protein F400_gp047 [Bacillus phage BCD7]|uniref:Uncharacterized protein n=1 Tax=Bacillus phage BCD7 TaxID=1136534 RepID=J9PV70_9CAUD|nr:hypothetical protein F400_gp047 [Bacillus phage BCD7]AEZ50494.1 hypothetical protein BCD7_0047 [Bacillus phage BCD7]